MSKESTNKTTISLEVLLLAAFIFCKVAGVTAIATWSWFWVLSPLWIPIVIALVVIGIGVFAMYKLTK